MRNMKTMAACAATLVLVAGGMMTGCGKKTAGQSSPGDPVPDSATVGLQDKPDPVTWKPVEAGKPSLNGEQVEIYARATGGEERPAPAIAALATKSSSGKDWMFLCQREDDGRCQWELRTVNENADGGPSLTGTVSLDLADILTDQHAGARRAGGWKPCATVTPAAVLDEYVAGKWNEALDGSAAELTPIALLGQHVGTGVSYKLLCYGKASEGQREGALYAVTVLVPVDGGASIEEASALDLSRYASLAADDLAAQGAEPGSGDDEVGPDNA